MFRALIVEDNEAFRASLHGALARRFPFMQIGEAEDGEAALQDAFRRRPDLVFMDIRLPGRNGLDVARILRSMREHAMLCVLTSYDLPEYREAALACGAEHFLVKDECSEAQIVELVNGYLDKRVRTLIVEDNALFREALDRLLRAHWPAMVVVEAADGPDGLEEAGRLRPDVVLLDLRLPSANGLELAAPLRVAAGGPAIVAMTAYDHPQYREAAARVGIPHFVAKNAAVGQEIVGIVGGILAERGQGGAEE